MIDLADRGDDLAPAGVKFLRVGELEPDAKNSGAMRLGDRRHLHDPGFVIGKEAIPFFLGLKIDLAAPEELRSPIGDVRDEHDGHAALARPIERSRDVTEIVSRGSERGRPP